MGFVSGSTLGVALDAGVVGLHIVKLGGIDDIRLAPVLDVIAAGAVAFLAANVPLGDFLGVDIVIDRVASIAERPGWPLHVVGGVERCPPVRAVLDEVRPPELFFRRRAREIPRPERKTMIERDGEVSVKRQAELLDLSRSSVYYVARGLPERDLKLMRILDELHLKWPFYGARKLTRELQNQGHEVGRRHVTTLMRRMGMETIYRKPRTSIPAPLSAVYPYLLNGLKIERPNHVWAADLTYIPMAHGFQYLMAIIDVGSRKTLSWRVSNTMTPDFCLEALQEALGKYGKPEIFNTDQGSQFTCEEWIDTLKAAGVQISMDGKGRWIDNVFIERLWRSVKYENIYLRAYETGTQLRRGLTEYFDFYNGRRIHEALGYATPDEVYFAGLAPVMAAAA